MNSQWQNMISSNSNNVWYVNEFNIKIGKGGMVTWTKSSLKSLNVSKYLSQFYTTLC